MARSGGLRPRRRWGRFWLLMVPSVLVAAGTMALVAQGAVAASVAASGRAFKVSGDQLSGSGFMAVPTLNAEPGGARHPVLAVTARRAKLANLCVSMLVDTPLGEVTVRATAGRKRPVRATGLLVHSDQVSGGVTFTDVMATAQPEGHGEGGLGGMLARTASVSIDEPRFTGWKGAAGSFHLQDLRAWVEPGAHECF